MTDFGNEKTVNTFEDTNHLTEGINTTLKLSDVEDKGEEGGDGDDNGESVRLAAEAAEATRLLEAGKSNNTPKVLEGFTQDKDKDTSNIDSTVLSPVAHLMNKYGYSDDAYKEIFKDLDLESDDIVEIEKFYEKRDELVAAKVLQGFLENDSDLKDLYEHKKQGLSINTWKEKVTAVDWSKFEVPKDKPDIVENIVREGLLSKGLSPKAVDRNINSLKDDEDAEAMYNEALETVKDFDKQTKGQVQANILREQEEIKANNLENQKVIQQITDIVTKGDLIGYSVPELERQDLIKYVNSDERVTKWDKLPIEAKLFVDNIIRKYDVKEGKFKIKGFETSAQNKKISIKTENSGRKGTTGGASNEDTPTMSLEEVRKYLKN